jgi:hypothetical protein
MKLTEEQIESLRDEWNRSTNPCYADGFSSVLKSLEVSDEQIRLIITD